MIKITGIDKTLKAIKDQSKVEIVNQKAIVEESLVRDLKAATPVDTGRASKGWKRVSVGIENSVEYIDELNAGSSTQAPAYFVERTILSHPGISPSGIIVVNK
jgi:hypothetical protein